MPSDMERLAVYQAVMNKVADEVKTGDPSNLRGAVDAQMAELYETTGAKSANVRVNGQKVGTYSVRVTSAPVVTDEDALRAYMADCGMRRLETAIDLDAIGADAMADLIDMVEARWPQAVVVRETYPGRDALLKALVRQGRDCIDPETGAVVPGVEWREAFAGGTLKGCKWDQAPKGAIPVAAALGHELAGGLAGLLGGDA